MHNYDLFDDAVKKTADSFRSIDKSETIRIVSHLDCDGICACAVMINALNRENRRFSISIIHQLNDKVVQEFKNESYNVYVFTDLGSGQISSIEKHLKGRNIFVLDHHEPEKKGEFVHHLNPHLFGTDGSKEVSGSGVVYLFAKELDKENRSMAHIAVIGAIGDVQEKDGFMHINSMILDNAVKHGKMEISRGLRIFGCQTRPLHKMLEYSNDPYIPGVSGSESRAVQFLQQAGIRIKSGNDWRTLSHLSSEEQKRLASAIIKRRLSEEKPEDIFGPVYTLVDEERGSCLRDAKEYATLLNACGRLGKASLGIGVCMGDMKTKQKAIAMLSKYKREIVTAINWFKDKGNRGIIEGKGFIIINAQDKVMPTIIGTLSSIISKSGEFVDDGLYVMGLAWLDEGTTKVSLRMSAPIPKDTDLRSVLQEITSRVGGDAGGHMLAAGALIDTEKEEEFIAAAREILEKHAMEESVLE